MIHLRGSYGLYFIEEFGFILSLCIHEFSILIATLYHGRRISLPTYMLELGDLFTCSHYGFRCSHRFIHEILLFYCCLCYCFILLYLGAFFQRSLTVYYSNFAYQLVIICLFRYHLDFWTSTALCIHLIVRQSSHLLHAGG